MKKNNIKKLRALTHRVHLTVHLVPEHLLVFYSERDSNDEWMRMKEKKCGNKKLRLLNFSMYQST